MKKETYPELGNTAEQDSGMDSSESLDVEIKKIQREMVVLGNADHSIELKAARNKLTDLQARRAEIARRQFLTDPGRVAARNKMRRFIENHAVLVARQDQNIKEMEKAHRARGKALLLGEAAKVKELTAKIEELVREDGELQDAKAEFKSVLTIFEGAVTVADESAHQRTGYHGDSKEIQGEEK